MQNPPPNQSTRPNASESRARIPMPQNIRLNLPLSALIGVHQRSHCPFPHPPGATCSPNLWSTNRVISQNPRHRPKPHPLIQPQPLRSRLPHHSPARSHRVASNCLTDQFAGHHQGVPNAGAPNAGVPNGGERPVAIVRLIVKTGGNAGSLGLIPGRTALS
jgi:hypothetical protein